MPQDLLINDFSAGWIIGDDPISGRKNGLLRMDSIELDNNGALRMCGGSTQLGSSYAHDAHTIYSKFLKDGRYSYLGFTNGDVFRNNTSILTSGSTTRAAFGAAFDYVIICSGAVRAKDDGTTHTNLGITRAGSPSVAVGGGGVLNGNYEYVQINVNPTGAYIPKSPPSSASSGNVNPVNNVVTVTPASLGGNAQAWIYRRSTDGGQLDQYYRVAVVTSTTPFSDNLSDEDTLDQGITMDLRALSVNSTDLPDDILEVVGPMNKRMVYFTKSGIHFSETNSPDSYSPGQSINYAGGATGSEIFLFARKVADNVIMVGTTKDYYILVGTFVTQPDGTLDVYFRGLNVENPPIAIDADVYNGSVVAMTAAGWKLTGTDGSQTKITDTRTDRLYRGETINANSVLSGYAGIPILIIPQQRYACCVVRDKLYVRVPLLVNGVLQTVGRMEVYDFKRNYWRPCSTQTPALLFGQEDDSVLGFVLGANGGPSLVINDYFASKALHNGSLQTVTIVTPILDMGKPRNRKDLYNLKLKINTFNNSYSIGIFTDDGSVLSTTVDINTGNQLVEVNIPVYDDLDITAAKKNFQFYLSGSGTDLLISDISISYDVRPDQISRLIYIFKGGPNRKRIRTQPFKLDTLNATAVQCQAYVDGVQQPQVDFPSDSYERTYNYYFNTDVFGVDYKYVLNCESVFEFYEAGEPSIAEVAPMARQFAQLGPIELFRYGKLKEFEIRVLPYGTVIPYVIYFEDNSSTTGNIVGLVSGADQMAFINLPDEVEGSVMRVELGPTNFDFHLWYGRMKTQRKGKDTEIEYVQISPDQDNGVK